jgi:hypothetical protein
MNDFYSVDYVCSAVNLGLMNLHIRQLFTIIFVFVMQKTLCITAASSETIIHERSLLFDASHFLIHSVIIFHHLFPFTGEIKLCNMQR